MKTAEYYKDKIRKLLKLAQSQNENEAKDALLKARQLMAEHKLTERELGDAKKQDVVDIRTEITCSKRRNPWIVNLSATIGENYCCRAYRAKNYKSQTQKIGFIGLQEDVEICTEVFKYAVDCVLAGIERVKKQNAGYSQSYIKMCCNGYGYGFDAGCQEAFARQKQENESGWALVLVVPKEVDDAVKDFGKEEFRARAQEQIPYSAYSDGKKDGRQFRPNRRINAEATA